MRSFICHENLTSSEILAIEISVLKDVKYDKLNKKMYEKDMSKKEGIGFRNSLGIFKLSCILFL
jgi:hypothetical protein